MLRQKNWINRPLHIISANLHSVKNVLYAPLALADHQVPTSLEELAKLLSQSENQHYQDQVDQYAHKHGLHFIDDRSGMNIDVQLIDLSKWQKVADSSALEIKDATLKNQPLIIVIDYAFGEQAYEVMDELLKPFEEDQRKTPLQVASISIMGKAGVLQGKKGDIMIPQAHVFEGTADNYPFSNGFKGSDFEGYGLDVYSEGPMITVLGTSLQNKDILRYFCRSSWNAIGLEMEGAHYQKAIQAAAKIRKSIRPDVKLYFAYYASDNPLVSGQTLTSGSLGLAGVKPTYLITQKILTSIFNHQ